MRRATPSATSARPWWSSAAWSARPKAHCFVIDLPHSDGCFVKAYPAETTEAFLDGHVSAFAFLGGVPQSILYDNTRLAVAKILGDGRRQRTRAFTELQSHYLFEDRFGRPGKGNDKGKVEGLVGYVRRNFLVPVPSFESFDALNAYLERRCLERMDAKLRGHMETIGQRMERDLDALLPLPSGGIRRLREAGGPGEFPVSGKVQDQRLLGAGGLRAPGRAGTGLRGPRWSSAAGPRSSPDTRSYERDDFVYDPIHYLPLLEQKTGALDQAAPLQGWDLPEEFGTLRRLAGVPHGTAGQAGVRAGAQAAGDLLQQEGARSGQGCPPAGSDELRRGEAPGAVRLEGRPPASTWSCIPTCPGSG